MMGKINTQDLSWVHHLLGFLQNIVKFPVFPLQDLFGLFGLLVPLLQ